MADENTEYTPEEIVEHSFTRTQETADFQADRTEHQWEVIRDECVSGGALNSSCNVVAASLGQGHLDVVAQRLSCGCLMVAMDAIEELDWDISGEEAGK